MANTSATGGYLLPVGGVDPVTEQTQLENAIQQWIAGVSGIAPEFVRPRWQETPPNQPGKNVHWCAFGIHNRTPDFDAFIRHGAAGSPVSTEVRNIALEVLVSFYGPACSAYAGIFASGTALRQNRTPLHAAGLVFTSIGTITPAPALVNGKWLQKADVPVYLTLQMARAYGIFGFIALPADAVTDGNNTQQLGCFGPDGV